MYVFVHVQFDFSISTISNKYVYTVYLRIRKYVRGGVKTLLQRLYGPQDME